MCGCWGGMGGCWGAWLLGGMRGCQGGVHCCGGVHGCRGACVGHDEIRSMSGRYASYWNAFLLSSLFSPGVMADSPILSACHRTVRRHIWPGVW